MEIRHFSHHHPLSTLVLLNEVGYGTHSCKICWENLAADSVHYGCKECNFFIHKSCAKYPRELQHPSHPKHLLLLLLCRLEPCANCTSNRFEFKYMCPHCYDFYLCPQCAFLPLFKEVENHDHPLNLMQKVLPFKCDACWKEGNGMSYFCLTCSFMIHPECTPLPLVEQTSPIHVEIHNHPLTLVPKFRISLTCNVCWNEINDRFYFCATCSFVAHPNCALVPSMVKVIRHKHPLKLIYSPPADQSKRRVCQLCAKTVEMINYWVYYCSSHQDFVAHLHCAASKEEIDETFVLDSFDLSPYDIVKEIKPEGDRIEIHTEIKHFSHEHDLKLANELEIDKQCNACIRSISLPFYACAQCEFFLHKSCAKLPRKSQNSLHQHPLELLLTEQFTSKCDACCRSCNGFLYCCKKCNFNVDVQCSLIPDIFTHPSHEGELILARSSEGKACSICGSDEGFRFRCVDCEFTVDFQCLTLPHTISYEKHDHLFTLRYTSEDDSGEFYCDICEKKRDPKCWFYYCADCSYPAHPECILGKYPNLKTIMK